MHLSNYCIFEGLLNIKKIYDFTTSKYSLTQADVIILSVWGSAILFAILPLAGWNKFVSEVSIVLKSMNTDP